MHWELTALLEHIDLFILAKRVLHYKKMYNFALIIPRIHLIILESSPNSTDYLLFLQLFWHNRHVPRSES